MRPNLPAVVLAVAASVLMVVTPRSARADPDYGEVFDVITMQLRGFTGFAPGFGTGLLSGGDLRLGIEAPAFGFLFGGRIGAAGSTRYEGPVGAQPAAAQLAVGDIGIRAFLNPRESLGYYVGGGLGIGSTFIDDFAFRNASFYGVYAELGTDLPRTSPARLTAALRIDAGVASLAEYSRVPAAGVVVAITVNVGFLLGGSETGCEDD